MIRLDESLCRHAARPRPLPIELRECRARLAARRRAALRRRLAALLRSSLPARLRRPA